MPANEAPQPKDLFPWSATWVCWLLFGVTLVAYLPALQGGFIWDDPGHVTRPDLRSFAGLLRIWFEPGATQQYYPMLHSAFWVEHNLWGDSALGYHLINVLLHAGSACLLGRLLCKLAVPGAWLAAFLFALHPVCVESVAWITEQKNTLSLLFYLLAAHAYLRFDEQRCRSDYLRAGLFFVAALLSKTVTASLPAALLVVFWWRRGRLDWRRDLLPLSPWFVFSAGSGLLTAWMEHAYIGAQGADYAYGFVERCLIAGRAFWFYLGKLLWPADLIFIYPRWTIDASAWWQYLFPLAGLGLTGILLWFSKRMRGPLAVLLLFGGSLFPALGFINVYPFVFSFVADHFQYLASLAVFAGAGWVGATLGSRFLKPGLLAPSFVVLLLLGSLTWLQAGMYRDLVTLYETTIARNPSSWMPYNNLGVEFSRQGRHDEALAHFRKAIELRPDYAPPYNNLGDSLNTLGRHREARDYLRRAIELMPGYAEAHCNLGVALLSTGQEQEGIASLEQALRLKPHYPMAHFNLGLAHARGGRMAAALHHFEIAVQQNPDNEAARNALTRARRQIGR